MIDIKCVLLMLLASVGRGLEQGENWEERIMLLTVMKRLMLLAILAFAPAAALAQGYPSRPVTVIVVFAAGGPSDTIARLLSDHVGRQFGQQLIVENVAGAGGTTGTDRAANAAADGYTVLTHHRGL